MLRNLLEFKVPIRKSLIYLTAFLLILNCASVYITLPGTTNLSRFVSYGPVLILLLLLSTNTIKFAIGDFHKIKVLFRWLIIYLFLFIVFSHSPLVYSFSKLITIFVLIIYFFVIERQHEPYLLIAYRDILTIIAIISLFFWLFGTVLKVIDFSGYVSTSWTSVGKFRYIKNYFYLYFESDISVKKSFLWIHNITRNASIFTEGGFAALNYSIAMLYELFIEQEKSKERLIILTLAVGTTLSTTGYVSLIIAYGLYYLFNIVDLKHNKRQRRVIMLVALLFAYFIFNKIYQDKILTHSGMSRLSDYINGFRAWRRSPLFGYGYGNHAYINRVFHTGYSNSISAILTQGGLALMLLYILCFGTGIFKCIQSTNKNKLAFILSFLALFSVLEIGFSNITIYIMIYLALYRTDIVIPIGDNKQIVV